MIKTAAQLLAEIGDQDSARRHNYPATRLPPTKQGNKCAIPTCSGNPVGKQLCKRHLGRLERHGDPLKCVRRPGRKCACDGCREAKEE